MFLSSGDGYFGEILELHPGCQGPFRGARVKVGFLSRCHNRKGPHLVLSVESPGFSRVASGILGFLSSYDGDLREVLVLPQESQVSMRDKALFHCSITREILHSPLRLAGSLTPLMQLKKFPDIPVSTREEHRVSRHNSRRAPFCPPHL